MSKRKDQEAARARQYAVGASALALVCFCVLCIIFLTIPAHAAQGPLDVTPTDTSTPSPTDTSTPSPTVTNTPSPTVTTTPSPTTTSTPSPTVTHTASPTPTGTHPASPTATTTPSPGVTRTVSASPTTTPTAGAQLSPTAAVSPTGTQGIGTNQSSGGSPITSNHTGDSSRTGANPLTHVLPFLLAGLGGIGLLALLFIPLRNFLRRRLVPLPSPKVPPSGAAPWSRTPVSAQPGQPFPPVQPGSSPFNAPGAAPFPGAFNAAPTLANAPARAWRPGAPPAGPLAPSTPPVVPVLTNSVNQAQAPRPFPETPALLAANGYVGLTQNQPPLPITPPHLPGVQASYAGSQSQTPAGPAQPGDPSADTNRPGDSFNNMPRKRLRRNGLRASSGEHAAFPEQFPGASSAGASMMVVSDPFLRAMPKQHNLAGQVAQQAPEELS